jgi:hypothetical protein
MNTILNKPTRSYDCMVEGPEPCFKDYLIATLQNDHGVNKERAETFIENKLKGIASNVLIDKCIGDEITKRLNAKILKRVEKIQTLEGIEGTFKEMLPVTQCKKVARFKEEYNYLLSAMIE